MRYKRATRAPHNTATPLEAAQPTMSRVSNKQPPLHTSRLLACQARETRRINDSKLFLRARSARRGKFWEIWGNFGNLENVGKFNVHDFWNFLSKNVEKLLWDIQIVFPEIKENVEKARPWIVRKSLKTKKQKNVIFVVLEV